MKFYVVLIIVVLTKIYAVNTNEIFQDVVEINYKVTTRGSYYECSIKENRINVIEQGTNERKSSEILNLDQWFELVNLIKDLQIENIQQLKTPSFNYTSDRARICQLTIKTNTHSYESVSFDEGNPPKELEALINKILALAQGID